MGLMSKAKKNASIQDVSLISWLAVHDRLSDLHFESARVLVQPIIGNTEH